MKRWIINSLFLLWACAAQASVPCSLPFNLQNSTTADATQVMSNYNAIITCLGNAAGAGTNTDITSIVGLTTPLSSAQGGSNSYVGGVSTGAANAQIVATVVPANFTMVQGRTVYFVAGFTNNGPTQVNVNGQGLTNVFAQGTGGQAALVGGEIVAGQVMALQHDGTQFQLLNPAPISGVPPGTIIDVAFSIPAGYLAANGQVVSRTTFAALFSAITFTTPASTTIGSGVVTGISNTASLAPGMPLGGANTTCGATIVSVDSVTQVTITPTAAASGATTLVFAPWGAGNCSTTFSTPNLQGRMTAGIDGAANITSFSCVNAGTPGALCGSQGHVQTAAELAVHAHSINDPAHFHNGTMRSSGNTPAGGVSPGSNNLVGLNSVNSDTAVTGITINNAGASVSMPILNPVAMVRKAIKF